MRCKSALMACLCAFLLFATLGAFFSTFHMSHAAEVIQVPQDYPTIQQAISAASAGDTIRVNRRSGESQSVYYERLTVDKQLVLVGESRETVIIDGSAGGTVVRVRADYVQIRNLTIRNAGQYSGVRSNGYFYTTVANNTVSGNKYGIAMLNSDSHTVVYNLLFNNSASGISLSESVGNNVSDNEVSESAYGMKLSLANITFVVGNTVTDNSYGIYIAGSSNDTVHGNTLRRNSVNGIFSYTSHDIIISDNEVSESAYGIELHTSHAITVSRNNATAHSYAVYLAYSAPSNIVENNTISTNDWGVTLYNSSGNTIRGNMLSDNTFGIDPEAESNNNLIYHNNFIDNIEQAVWNPDCLNTWDDGYPSGGNYWSDYTGTDTNGDGIGDTAYSIDPMNKDRYPLMAEWGGIHDVATLNVIPFLTAVYPGEIVYVNVTVKNEGTWTETFDITAKYNSTTIDVQTVSNLAPSLDSILTFDWNTTEVTPGNYTLSAEATIVVFETDTADNTYTDGIVRIKTPVHDVAVTSVIANPTSVMQMQTVKIRVVVENEGAFLESFNVACYYDSMIISSQDVTDLPSLDSKILYFSWKTNGVHPGTYTIKAVASIVPGEIETADNIYTNGNVTITSLMPVGRGAGSMRPALFAPIDPT